MNLTDFEQTPIARVFEFVKREAARYGVMPAIERDCGIDPEEGSGRCGGVVSAGGELRLVADPGEPTELR